MTRVCAVCHIPGPFCLDWSNRIVSWTEGVPGHMAKSAKSWSQICMYDFGFIGFRSHHDSCCLALGHDCALHRVAALLCQACVCTLLQAQAAKHVHKMAIKQWEGLVGVKFFEAELARSGVL